LNARPALIFCGHNFFFLVAYNL